MTPTARLAFLSIVTFLGCPTPPGGGRDGGSQVPVRVVSWNLRQFGADGGTGERAASTLRSLSPDLVAVQEVVSEAAFADLTTRMPGFRSSLGPLASTAGGLRQGWLWKEDRLSVRDSEALFADGGVNFPRPPLQVRVDLSEGGQPRASFIAIAVHLKAGARAADEERRINALATLEQHMRSLVHTASADDEVLLLGDSNEDFRDPRFSLAFQPFTAAPSDYRFLTASFADAGIVTFLPRRLFFDHLIATTGLADETGGTLPLVPPLDAEQPDFASSVSDHLPIMLDLAF